MTNMSDMDFERPRKYHACCHPRVPYMFVLVVKVQYYLLACIHVAAAGFVSLDYVNAQFADVSDDLKEKLKYLLEKFELALTVDNKHIIVPSLMSDEMPSGFDQSNSDAYPPLRRVWLSDYIPDGFWPRLMCRIVKDHHISKVNKYIATYHLKIFLIFMYIY